MQSRKTSVFLFMVFVVIALGSVGFILLGSDIPEQSKTSTTSEVVTPMQAPQFIVTDTLTKAYTIDEIGLLFSASIDLTVDYQVERNSETDEPYLITLYVQNEAGGSQEYYQLYGLFEYGDDYTTETLQAHKQDLQPESVSDVTVGGYPAVEGQVKGERNRFVTYVLTDQGLFSLFTAEPTADNKQRTDEILSTFRFN